MGSCRRLAAKTPCSNCSTLQELKLYVEFDRELGSYLLSFEILLCSFELVFVLWSVGVKAFGLLVFLLLTSM